MAGEKLFYVGVKGLIQNASGEILLLLADVTTHRKNTKPYWDIPGGRIQGSNDAVSTLKREIEEETGVTELQDIQFLTAVISNHEIPLSSGGSAGLVLMVYKVKIPDDSNIVISQEHSEYAWVSRLETKSQLVDKYPLEFTDQL